LEVSATKLNLSKELLKLQPPLKRTMSGGSTGPRSKTSREIFCLMDPSSEMENSNSRTKSSYRLLLYLTDLDTDLIVISREMKLW